MLCDVHCLLFAHDFGVAEIDDRLLLSVVALQDLDQLLVVLLFQIPRPLFLISFESKYLIPILIVYHRAYFEELGQGHRPEVSHVDLAVEPCLQKPAIVQGCAHADDLESFLSLDLPAENLERF